MGVVLLVDACGVASQLAQKRPGSASRGIQTKPLPRQNDQPEVFDAGLLVQAAADGRAAR